MDYDSLNETVLEGTVLTYQCDNGLTQFGSVNITCLGDGEWSSDPDMNACSGKCKLLALYLLNSWDDYFAHVYTSVCFNAQFTMVCHTSANK